MDHLKDIQLIEYGGGRLSAETRDAVEAHLSSCEACREKLHQARQTWDALGSWEAGPPEVDLSGRVIARLETEQAEGSQRGPYRLQDWVWPMAKLAASIGVAALLGHTAGMVMRPGPASLTADTADTQQAADELYLDIFTDDEPAGLMSVVLPPDTPDTEA